MDTFFVGKREAERLTGLSHETLKKMRLRGDLRENIEWVRQNSRCVRYNASLLSSFIQNRSNPEQHAIAVERYLASLPHNQAKTRGRKAA